MSLWAGLSRCIVARIAALFSHLRWSRALPPSRSVFDDTCTTVSDIQCDVFAVAVSVSTVNKAVTVTKEPGTAAG